jgi:murein DD-endopeptidase MepM/ murein hydrolase activator NlpD
MNGNIKEKLANRTVYIILALLLITVITVTIVAITATVSKRNELPTDVLPEQGDNGGVTPEQNLPDAPSDVTPEPDVPSDVTPEPETPAKPVYVSPCGDGYIQKGYSEDVLVFSSTTNEHRIHLGIDISGKLGDPVYAFSDGVIEKIYKDYFMGQTVVIDHGNGLKSCYMNLAETLPEGIKVGKKVAHSTVIGAIGETANLECADSPHLHFELRLGDKTVNPSAYITLPNMPTSSKDFEEA